MSFLSPVLDPVEGSHTTILGVSFVTFSLLTAIAHSYWTSKKNLKRPAAEWANECVSFVHGLISIGLSGYSLLHSKELVYGQPTTPLHRAIFAISLGYVLVDSVYLIYHKLMDATVAFHHVATTLGLAYGVFMPESGAEMVVAMATLEITNPCLHIRWMLRALELKESKVYVYNELIFFGVFVLARVIFAVPFTKEVLWSPNVSTFVKTSASMLQLLSLVWAIFMAKIFFVKYVVGRPKGQKSKQS